MGDGFDKAWSRCLAAVGAIAWSTALAISNVYLAHRVAGNTKPFTEVFNAFVYLCLGLGVLAGFTALFAAGVRWPKRPVLVLSVTTLVATWMYSVYLLPMTHSAMTRLTRYVIFFTHAPAVILAGFCAGVIVYRLTQRTMHETVDG